MKYFLSQIKKKRVILCVLLFLFVLLSCAKLFLSCSTPSFDSAFETFTEELFRQELSSNTISLHYTLSNPEAYGITSAPVTFGEIQTDSDSARTSIKTCLSALENFANCKLSEENRLTYNILHFYLTTGEQGADYLLYQEPLGSVSGAHTQLPILLSEYQFHDAEDVKIYLELLAQTDKYFDSILSFEKQKADAGLLMTDSQIDSVIDYCETFLEMGSDNFLYSSFDEKLEKLSVSEASSLREKNHRLLEKTVFPAYENLISELSMLKGKGTNDMGLCHFPEGKNYYEYLILQDTGISEDIIQLKDMIHKQLIEDLLDLEKSYRKADDNLSFSEIPLLFSTPEDMLEHVKSKYTSSFPLIPDVSLDIKYVSSDMEEFLSPAFYMIPAIDKTSENVIYINKGHTVEGLNLFTTLAHEGYPGHLYQTVYFASTNPNPIRNILDFGGYVEGWATYAEMMSYYLAPLDSTEAAIFQKNNSFLLGLYAFADIGIHYDGWSLKDTIDFFSGYGITDENVIKEIYKLILGSPANYLKYYLGYLKFYTLKKEVAAKLGDDFSQLEFHKAVLDVGPAPFDIVEEYVKEELY